MTLREAAKNLGVSRETVRRMVLDGRLLAYRIGHRLVIPETELDRIRAECVIRPITVSSPSRWD